MTVLLPYFFKKEELFLKICKNDVKNNVLKYVFAKRQSFMRFCHKMEGNSTCQNTERAVAVFLPKLRM